MNLRKEVFSHHEKLWVLCLDEKVQNTQLSPLLDTVDWYNNQLLTKMLIQNKISLTFGTKTLLSTSGLLPVSRLIIYGLGEKRSLSDEAGTVAKDLNITLEQLGETNPWIIISSSVQENFSSALQKSISKFDRFSESLISVS